MIAAAREKVASWIAPSLQESIDSRLQEAIDFSTGFRSQFHGQGVGSNQPRHETLLKEISGVADMATRAIANRLSSLNPQVKLSVRQAEGTLKDEILDDHVLKLLLDRPHPNYTRRQMIRLATQHIVTLGEAYWLKIRNPAGVTRWLQPLPPEKVTPRSERGFITGYWVRDGTGSPIMLDAAQVIRFWFPDPEALFGAEGYFAPNALVSDADTFARQHLRSHYQWDATPGVILESDKDVIKPDPKQWKQFRQEWWKRYSRRKGRERGVPAALPAGWHANLTPVAGGQEITPLLEHWQSNQLMNFGTPSSILGRVISGDRSAAETNQFVFDQHTILPIAEMIADSLTLQLATEFDEAIFVEFEKFVSADKAFELEREGQDLDKKVRTTQQVLIARGEDPEMAPWGELPVGTLSDTPYTGEERERPTFVESESEIDEPPDEDEDLEQEDLEPPRKRDRVRKPGTRVDEALFTKSACYVRVIGMEKRFTPGFARQMREIFKRQLKSVLDNLEDLVPRSRQKIKAKDLFDPEGWGPLFDTRTKALRKKAHLFAAREGMTLVGLEAEEFIFTEVVAKKLAKQAAKFVDVVNLTTARRIRKAVAKSIAEGATEGLTLKEISRLVEKDMRAVFKIRRNNATTIARTEMHRATQSGQLEGFDQAGVEGKRWVDAADSDVRESHNEALIDPVLFDEDFVLASGAIAAHPNDPRLAPEESINCRCDVAPVFDVTELAA